MRETTEVHDFLIIIRGCIHFIGYKDVFNHYKECFCH
jgi:hypothetical protein